MAHRAEGQVLRRVDRVRSGADLQVTAHRDNLKASYPQYLEQAAGAPAQASTVLVMSRRKTTEPVTVTAVHPDVWTDALRQAGGDARRIEIISQTSVVVHNRADWRSAKVTATDNKATESKATDNKAADHKAAHTKPKVTTRATGRATLTPVISAPEAQELPARVEPSTPIPAASFVAPQLRSER